jgi:hypothetical protein
MQNDNKDNLARLIADGLRSVSKEQPLIINLAEPEGAYIQAIIAKSGNYLFEVSGNKWLATRLTKSQESKFLAFDWKLDPEVSNYFMEFSPDSEFEIMANIVALTVTQAFGKDINFAEEIDPYWPNWDELEQMIIDNERFWTNQVAALENATLYDESFKEILILCEVCKKVFDGAEAKVEFQGNKADVYCPGCNTKFKSLSK